MILPLINLGLAILLVFANAFFVLAEFAFVKVRPTRLKELIATGNSKALTAKRVTEHLDAYLSATQLGITLASLGLGWLGEPSIARLLEPLLHLVGIGSPVVLHAVAGGVAFAIITILHIVLGELAPKSLAILNPERSSLFSARPLVLFYRVAYPAIHLLNGAANWLLGRIGASPTTEADLVHSEEEIRLLVSASHEQGVLRETERDLVYNVFDFAERTVREVMVPRRDMICLRLGEGAESAQEKIVKYGYSRYPVCDRDRDHIVRVVHVTDLLPYLGEQGELPLEEVGSEPMVVPDTLRIDELLRKMREERTYLVIVVDEWGGVEGIATLEDVIEELVGDIRDESESRTARIVKLEDGAYELDGRLLIEEVNELLNSSLSTRGMDTIGGWVFGRLGRLPKEGDEVEAGGYVFRVTGVDGPRVTRVYARQADSDLES